MARKHKCPDCPGPGWLTTYGDMVTLLMAFFVMLFAISSVDEKKFLTLLKGLEASFGNSAYQDSILNGGESVIGANLAAGSVVPVPGGNINVVPAPSALAVDQGDSKGAESPQVDAQDPPDPQDQPVATTSIEEALTEGQLQYEHLGLVQEAIEEAAAKAGVAALISFDYDERGLVIRVGTDEVLFASGSAVLRSTETDVLAVIAEVITRFENTIFVDGHTDNVPLNRAGYTILNLSADRAIAVVVRLTTAHEVDPARLVASGYGEYRPVDPDVDNDDTGNRTKNRRVEIVVAATPEEAASLGEGVNEGGAPTDGQRTEPVATEIELPGAQPDGVPPDLSGVPPIDIGQDDPPPVEPGG